MEPQEVKLPVLQIEIGTSLKEIERRAILATYRLVGGNKQRAAAILGVSLKTLYNKLNNYNAGI